MTQKNGSLDLITVPNLSDAELCQLAQEKLGLKNLSPYLATWGFITDEAGKTYEAMVRPHGHSATTDEVRKCFPEGFVGNTAAFIAWVAANNPMGWYVSIPEDERLFQLDDDLYALVFTRGDRHRSLYLSYIGGVWPGHCSPVAFREVRK